MAVLRYDVENLRTDRVCRELLRVSHAADLGSADWNHGCQAHQEHKDDAYDSPILIVITAGDAMALSLIHI